MCWGGSKLEQPAPAPQLAMPPSTVATTSPEEQTSATADKKRRQLAAIKYGMASTIKTGPQGDTSTPNLLQPAMAAGLKDKLGS